VHDDHRHLAVGGQLPHRGVVEPGHVVDDIGSGIEGGLGDRGLARVDREPHVEIGDGVDHRDDAVDLVGDGHRLRAGARALAADIDDIGARIAERFGLFDGGLVVEELAAVVEAVRRDVENPHDGGAVSPRVVGPRFGSRVVATVFGPGAATVLALGVVQPELRAKVGCEPRKAELVVRQPLCERAKLGQRSRQHDRVSLAAVRDTRGDAGAADRRKHLAQHGCLSVVDPRRDRPVDRVLVVGVDLVGCGVGVRQHVDRCLGIGNPLRRLQPRHRRAGLADREQRAGDEQAVVGADPLAGGGQGVGDGVTGGHRVDREIVETPRQHGGVLGAVEIRPAGNHRVRSG